MGNYILDTTTDGWRDSVSTWAGAATASASRTNGSDRYVRTVGTVGSESRNEEDSFFEYVDLSGEERYNPIRHLLLPHAHVVAVVYAIDSRESFEKCRTWVDIATKMCLAKETPTRSVTEAIILVGNKADCELSRQVPMEIGQVLADEFGFGFCEVSATTRIGVEALFDKL